MKVSIGPYPDTWWSSRKWAEDIHARRHGKEEGWEVDVEDYDWIDRLVDWVADTWQSVLNVTVNPIISRRKRKIKVRIDPEDTWGMDTTLAHIILPMLKQLKATKHGSPWVDDEDVPHMVKKKKGKKKSEEEYPDDIHDRWEWVINEMIWAFEQVNAEDEGRSNYYVPYRDDEEVDRHGVTSSETGETFYFLTEDEARRMGRYDPDLHKAHQERVNRGLKFFGKYYQSLWD